ncbi:MAG: MAPEG family protein [Pseudomonadales bacterium]|nr:MAPEG family protein [Pseudomonadales bacterium]MBO6563311.1 MAPEG family protein [Pseudomonadales bacterium]MBO6595905.1 MAPEG family protein [Pseudomonadales bacterium]MBO6656770.1 MAPEG family protein [Pseudomonadales bacterium]MBO6702510.1 MAPEG family protein [Pseudomonadales bacterium]
MIFSEYETTLLSWAALILLLFIQSLVQDIVGIRAKHIPGAPVEGGHDDLLFRASRTVANTNETIAIYILAVMYCMISGADPEYTGLLSWGFVASRTAYALCYYSNQQTMRSVCFGLSLIAVIGLWVVGLLG